MAEHLKSRKTSSLVIIALAGLVLLAVLAAIKILMEPQIIVRDEPPPDSAAPADSTPSVEQEKTVIDYDKLGSDEALQALMTQRKEGYDVGEGIDIIARSDETVQIGGTTVSMKELQKAIQLKLGEIAEETLLSLIHI